MKTLKTVLVLAAAAAAFNLSAAERLMSPRDSGSRHSVIASSGVKDPNLIAGPRLGKNTPDVVLSTGATGVKDPNLLGAITKCSMAPKAKDTAACKKMCEVAGIK